MIMPSTAYNYASQPTTVNLLQGSEGFNYDGSGRMNKWTSAAGSSNIQSGTLTWNANGTLGKLAAMTDTYNGYNQQTSPSLTTTWCVWGAFRSHAGVNCLLNRTPEWTQYFDYDVWGNNTKWGSSNFTQGYQSNNRISTWPTTAWAT